MKIKQKNTILRRLLLCFLHSDIPLAFDMWHFQPQTGSLPLCRFSGKVSAVSNGSYVQYDCWQLKGNNFLFIHNTKHYVSAHHRCTSMQIENNRFQQSFADMSFCHCRKEGNKDVCIYTGTQISSFSRNCGTAAVREWSMNIWFSSNELTDKSRIATVKYLESWRF